MTMLHVVRYRKRRHDTVASKFLLSGAGAHGTCTHAGKSVCPEHSNDAAAIGRCWPSWTRNYLTCLAGFLASRTLRSDQSINIYILYIYIYIFHLDTHSCRYMHAKIRYVDIGLCTRSSTVRLFSARRGLRFWRNSGFNQHILFVAHVGTSCALCLVALS